MPCIRRISPLPQRIPENQNCQPQEDWPYETGSEEWSEREGRVVPESDGLRLGNDAVTLEGTVLYADLDDSTKLVDTAEPWLAAEVYKAYLVCAARIIRSEGGVITSYDGDRIMAVFIGDPKNTDAARTALKINFAVQKIVNPGDSQVSIPILATR